MNPTTPADLPRDERCRITHAAIQNEDERIREAVRGLREGPLDWATYDWQIVCAYAQIRAWRAHLRELEGS